MVGVQLAKLSLSSPEDPRSNPANSNVYKKSVERRKERKKESGNDPFKKKTLVQQSSSKIIA